jgi:hypothetical protein
MRPAGWLGSAWGVTLLYAVAAVALTWPLVPRAAQDLPADLLDPLFTCWALGWNFHAFGLTDGPRPGSYWDANIFHPTPMALARSEHFLAQALQGAPVYALTDGLVLTYNVLFLATFVLSGTFLYLFAREYTADRFAAAGAGLLYAFALFRWVQIAHLGGLSSQWMPLALLLCGRVVRAKGGRAVTTRIVALAAVTAVQAISSGYYLLYFPPFLAAWAAWEAWRQRGLAPWLRLAAAGALAVALALPMVLPYVALRAGGAERDLASVVEHSADLLSLVTAPALGAVWGPVLDAFPRGEARLVPGLVTPLLAGLALVAAVSGARSDARARGVPGALPRRFRTAARVVAIVLGAAALAGGALVLAGGRSFSVGPLDVRVMSMSRPALLMALAVLAAAAGWPRFNPLVRALFARPAFVAILLAALAVWLSLGPLVTLDGWPTAVPAAYRWLYEHAPGFESGRAPARFAMIAACFASFAAAFGFERLRASAVGRRLAWVLCGAFLLETTPAGLPLSQQWEVEGVATAPDWHDGAPSPIVAAIRGLPPEAVLAVLPFGHFFYETSAMFDAAHHWRRLANGYSSWTPEAYSRLKFAVRDPLRRSPDVVAALRAAGVTHVVVHERAWTREKGARVTERLIEAGARPAARAGDVALLAID